MAWGTDIMTTRSNNLLSLYPSPLTSVAFPRSTNSSSTSTSIAAEIMFPIGLHLYNRTLTCCIYKVSEFLCCTSQPHKVTWVLNGDRTFNPLIFIYLYLSSADKLIIKLNGMKGFYWK